MVLVLQMRKLDQRGEFYLSSKVATSGRDQDLNSSMAESQA